MTWPPTPFFGAKFPKASGSKPFSYLRLTIAFQDLVKTVIGPDYAESHYFHAKFIRYHGGYGGHSRVLSVVDESNPHCGPGQIFTPAVEFDCGSLTGDQYLSVMGKLIVYLFYECHHSYKGLDHLIPHQKRFLNSFLRSNGDHQYLCSSSGWPIGPCSS